MMDHVPETNQKPTIYSCAKPRHMGHMWLTQCCLYHPEAPNNRRKMLDCTKKIFLHSLTSIVSCLSKISIFSNKTLSHDNVRMQLNWELVR